MQTAMGPYLSKLNSTAQLALTREHSSAPVTVPVKILVYKDGKQIYNDQVIVPRDSSRAAVFDAAMRKPTLTRLSMGMGASPGVFTMNEKLTIRLRTPVKITAQTATKTTQTATKTAQAATKTAQTVTKTAQTATKTAQATKAAQTETDAAIPSWKRALVWATSLATVVFFSTHIGTLSEGDQSLRPAMAVAICALIIANLIIWFGKTNSGTGLAAVAIGINAPYGLLFILYYILRVFGVENIDFDLTLPDALEVILIIGMCVFMFYLMVAVGRLAYACAMDVRKHRKP